MFLPFDKHCLGVKGMERGDDFRAVTDSALGIVRQNLLRSVAVQKERYLALKQLVVDVKKKREEYEDDMVQILAHGFVDEADHENYANARHEVSQCDFEIAQAQRNMRHIQGQATRLLREIQALPSMF